MAEEEFIVLYTGQKTKKAKTWHDGTLKILAVGTKAVLYDDKQSRLDTVFVRAADILLGEQIESDRYLILIEERKSNNHTSADPVVQSAPVDHKPCGGQSVTGVRSGIAATRGGGGGGLKRKRTGFVPPRMVKVTVEDKTPSTGNQQTPVSEAPGSNLSPLHGMTSYKASIMSLYSRNKDADGPVRDAAEIPPSNRALTVRSHPGNDDSDVSPQLTNFMSKLRKSGSSSQESNDSGNSWNRGKSSPWTTFGRLKSDAGSQGSQSSAEEGIQHVSRPPAASAIKDRYRTDVLSKSKNDARNDVTDSHHSENFQQINLPSTSVTKRTTNQIMALLRRNSSSNVSRLSNQQNEMIPEPCPESVALTEQSKQDHGPGHPVEKQFQTTAKDYLETNQAVISEEREFSPEGTTMNTEFPDHKNMMDSVEQGIACYLSDSDAKGFSESEEQDPLETSNATFDINFSPLSHVSTSEDEMEREKMSKQWNKVEAQDGTDGQTNSMDNPCLESEVGNAEFCDNESLTVGMRTGPLSQSVVRKGELVEKNPNKEALASDFKTTDYPPENCKPETEQSNLTVAYEKMCKMVKVREGNLNDPQQKCEMIDQHVQPSPDSGSEDDNGTVCNGMPSRSVTSNGMPSRSVTSNGMPSRSGTSNDMPSRSVTSNDMPSRSVTSNDMPSRSGTSNDMPSRSGTSNDMPSRSGTGNGMPSRSGTGNGMPSRSGTGNGMPSRSVTSNGQPLKDLQFSPDSFDLNCSLSQLSQSGFLGTLNAASKETRNPFIPIKSSVTGSAFDDKPSRVFAIQNVNISCDRPNSVDNQGSKMKTSILDSNCSLEKNDCAKMEDECQHVAHSSHLLVKTERDSQNSEEDVMNCVEKRSVKDNIASDAGKSLSRNICLLASTKQEKMDRCHVVDKKESKSIFHENGLKTLKQANQNYGLLDRSSVIDVDVSPEIPEEVFSQNEGSDETQYGFTSSSESYRSVVVSDTDECNVKQNKIQMFQSDSMEADKSFPLPDTPDFIRNNNQILGESAEIEDMFCGPSYSKNLLQTCSNDLPQFHSSTQREYITSDSVISVSDLPGQNTTFQSSDMDKSRTCSLGPSENCQKQDNMLGSFSPTDVTGHMDTVQKHENTKFFESCDMDTSRRCSLWPIEDKQMRDSHLSSVTFTDVTEKVKRIHQLESEKYFTAKDVGIQDGAPTSVTVMSLPHPSRLCGDIKVKNSQAVPEEKRNVSQVAAEHLEGYTVKGMMSGSVARRQTTQQPSLEKMMVSAPYGRASRVTPGQLKQALHTVLTADKHRTNADPSAVSVESLNSLLRLHSDQNYEHPVQEEFKLKVSRVPVLEEVPSRAHMLSNSRVLKSERFSLCTDENVSNSSLTPVSGGHPSDEHWLVCDSQSSTSTIEPVPASHCLPSIRLCSKSVPAQQLNADSLSQDDSQEDFYVDWNDGKPKFVSKPELMEQQYKVQESRDYQNVPHSPCVMSLSSQSDFSTHDVHTVPQDGGKLLQDCSHEQNNKLTVQGENFRQYRRPLKTNPVEEMKQEGYDVYVESPDDGQSVVPQSSNYVRVNRNVTSTHKGSVFNDTNESEIMAQAPRLRPPSINSDLHSVRDRIESEQTGCFRYTGSARWERTRLGHKQLVEEEDQESKKEESRWGRYLQQQDKEVAATWQQGHLGQQTIVEWDNEKEETRWRRCVQQEKDVSTRYEQTCLGQRELIEENQEESKWRKYEQQDKDVSAKWQQSHPGQQEVIEGNNQEKEASKWGGYAQHQEEDALQMDREWDKEADTTRGRLPGKRYRNHYQADKARSFTCHQGLDADCDNFFGSFPKHDYPSVHRQFNLPAVYTDSPAFDFNDSFDEAFCDTENHSKLLDLPCTSEKTRKQTFISSDSRLHEKGTVTPLTDVAKSPDLFPTQEKPRNSSKSKFVLPRFINAPQSDKRGRNPDPSPAVGRSSKFKTPTVTSFSSSVLQGTKRSLCGELQFPSQVEMEANVSPVRQVSIPVRFPNVQMYKQIISAALREHLNILLFDLSKVYHSGLLKVDVSQYSGLAGSSATCSKSANPVCKCGVPSKMIQVKKDGPNKGRFFYACEAPRNQQCKFFQWMDQPSSNRKDGGGSVNRATLNSADSITAYIRGHGVTFYCECQYLHKYRDNYNNQFKKGVPAWVRQKQEENKKKCMYIKLSKRDASSFFTKDDIWIVSQTLMFEPRTTFIARSVYFGPNSNNEVEIEPLAGYSPSNWTNNAQCHAILDGNASTELTCLVNLEDHVHPLSLPILPHLLDKSNDTQGKVNTKLFTPGHFVMGLAESYVMRYNLNEDQCEAVMRVANMMNKDTDSTDPVLLIHGVFGAGKSFLLSVLVRFLVEVFEKNDSYTPDVPYPWKLLISSTTNVAVDRVLMGLLDLGFEDFIRVGSVKKIAKQVLPYSVHASGSDSQELKDLQQMLRSDIPPSEKQLVRRSIEKHRLGENKKKLGGVRVVGVTCAACSFSCLNKIHFPFVVLDECSQMTEPASMLPVARFCCEKLVLVGDPNQLDPTIQGSEAGHSEGLEQTLFDRMIKLDYSPVLLRTQYRCHPWISCIANTLFYNGQLQDGVTLESRAPLTPMFPTLSFYDVAGGEEQTDSSGSYYNVAEAQLVIMLIQGLLVEGVDAGSIGVITLYKAQMYKIITSLHTEHPSLNKELKHIQVSTVDAFQGGEREVIILSCVRTNNFGFIDNDKRTNVALTRAKHHLLITGHQRNLVRNKLWSQVIEHCRTRPHGVQNSVTVSVELRKLVHEKMSRTSEASSSQEGPPASGQGKKRRPGKRKRGEKEEDSPPMSLSGQDTENSSDSIQIVTPPDMKTDDVKKPVSFQDNHTEDMLDADDFVLSESRVNIPRKASQHTRKRQRLSHLLDPDAFVDNDQHSSGDELPTFV